MRSLVQLSFMAIDPSDVAQVAPALLAYLRDRLGHPLEYAEAPEQVTHGFSTHIYFFRVAGPALDQAWAGPLVLRCFPFADQGAFAEREGALQRFASDQGYPAPRPLAVETANDALGRPFIVMERLPGVTVLDKIGPNPAAAMRLIRQMADLHVAVHRLPVDDCPVPYDGPLLDRFLPAFRKDVDRLGLEQTTLFLRLGDRAAGLDARKMSVSTAGEMSRLLALIARHEAVSPEASQDMLRILRRQDYRHELSRLLPWNEMNMLPDHESNWVAEKGGAFINGVRTGGSIFSGSQGTFAMSAFCEGGSGAGGTGRESEGNVLLGNLGYAAWRALAAGEDALGA